MAEVYMPNSDNYRKKKDQPAEDKKLEKVISGTTVTRKKGFVNKLAELFFAEDIPDLKTYLINDILIPNLKDLLSDIIGRGSDFLLYGAGKTRSGRSSGSRYGTINYSSFSNKPARTVTASTDREKCYEEVAFDNIEDAEKAKDALLEILESYPSVTVADLYQIVGRRTIPINFEWGWNDLSGLKVLRMRDGRDWIYILDLPKPVEVN